MPQEGQGAGGLFGLDEPARNGQAAVTSHRITTDTRGGRELSPHTWSARPNPGPFGSCCGCWSPAKGGREAAGPASCSLSAPSSQRAPCVHLLPATSWAKRSFFASGTLNSEQAGLTGISSRLRDGQEELGCWALAERRRDVAPLGRSATGAASVGQGSLVGGWRSCCTGPTAGRAGFPGQSGGWGHHASASSSLSGCPCLSHLPPSRLSVLRRVWPDTNRALPPPREELPGFLPRARGRTGRALRLLHRSSVPGGAGTLDLPQGSLLQVTWPEGAAASLGSLGTPSSPQARQGETPQRAGGIEARHSPR